MKTSLGLSNVLSSGDAFAPLFLHHSARQCPPPPFLLPPPRSSRPTTLRPADLAEHRPLPRRPDQGGGGRAGTAERLLHRRGERRHLEDHRLRPHLEAHLRRP